MDKGWTYLIVEFIIMAAVIVALIILAAKGVISWGEFVISLILYDILIRLREMKS